MTFEEIATQALFKKINAIEHRTCPDQYVGIISSFDESQKDFPTRIKPEDRPDNLPCLIMTIESPHIDEFKNEPCPANGKTGTLIRKWISEIVDLSEYRDHGLILVNAVQNQCSLGAPTKCFRDKIFTSVWKTGGKELFKERIKGIYRKEDQLLNCCTKGNQSIIELRQMVQLAILETNLDCIPLRRTHPSSWHSQRNRNSIWKQKNA